MLYNAAATGDEWEWKGILLPGGEWRGRKYGYAWLKEWMNEWMKKPNTWIKCKCI